MDPKFVFNTSNYQPGASPLTGCSLFTFKFVPGNINSSVCLCVSASVHARVKRDFSRLSVCPEGAPSESKVDLLLS